ncbi:Histone-lysine N-methyltransferase MEDEA [Trichinella spiralis]|uniref:Histone-lysine N-methyltransferase MEDEA n=1 Tax=Trichinella spiralis TaxID=6334 RepID=A0ABR3KC78_TRISP
MLGYNGTESAAAALVEKSEKSVIPLPAIIALSLFIYFIVTVALLFIRQVLMAKGYISPTAYRCQLWQNCNCLLSCCQNYCKCKEFSFRKKLTTLCPMKPIDLGSCFACPCLHSSTRNCEYLNCVCCEFSINDNADNNAA